MSCDIPKLRQIFETLKADRAAIESEWDEIETYVMPMSGKVAEARGATPSQKTDIRVWDLTAPLACEHLAASLHGSVTSPIAKWLEFEYDDAELEKDQEAVRHREALAQLVWSELQGSDFNMEISSAYHEYAGIGNMLLGLEPGDEKSWDGLDFTAIPVREGYPQEDSRGRLHRFFRDLRWTALQIMERFGEEGTPERVKQLCASGQQAATKLSVVFAIYRRPEVPLRLDPAQPVLPENRPYGWVYFLGETGERLGDEGGYFEMPVVLARWARRPGQLWGFGRGHLALRNTKFLNSMKELSRAQAALAVAPPTLTTERGILSDLHLEPNGVTVVGNVEDVQVHESKGRFDVAAEVLQDERVEIRRCFHEDDLQLKESPAMTATEVQARRDLMDRVLGSPVGRLQADALVPIVEIVLRMLFRAGRLPEAPQSVKAAGAEVKVRFRGPIARAQLMDEVVGIEREASFVAGLLKMGFEDARYYFDVGQAIREHSRRVGAPATTLRSKEEAEKMKRADQALAQASVQAKTARDQAGAMKDAATAMAAAGAPPDPSAFPMGPQPGLVPSGAMTP